MFEEQDNLPNGNLLKKVGEPGLERPAGIEVTKETPVGPLEIHTMPEKFFPKEEKKKKLPLILVILGIFIFLALIGGGAYLFASMVQKRAAAPKTTEMQPTEPAVTNANVEVKEPFVSEQKIVQAKTLDETGELISSAKLIFPEGGLEEGVEVTLSSTLPVVEIDPRYKVIGGIYTFSPAEIKLLKPATFVFVYKSGLVDQEIEKYLKVGALQNGLWKELPSSVDEQGNMATADIRQFYSDTHAIIISKEFFIEPETQTGAGGEGAFINIAVPSGADSDRDGLTNEEESQVYQTNVNNPDTDGDGYPDGLEIIGFYNPLAGSGSGLSVSGLINTYSNPVYYYSVFYPASFLAKALEGTENREVMFTAHTGEFIEIIVQDNPRRLTAVDWYLEQVPGVESSQLRKTTVNEMDAVWSLDGLTIYIAEADKIYVITYNYGARTDLSFKTTFEMMIKSFTLLEKPIDLELEGEGE